MEAAELDDHHENVRRARDEELMKAGRFELHFACLVFQESRYEDTPRVKTKDLNFKSTTCGFAPLEQSTSKI